ncbi:hypothetical protein [Algoriphagus terrigena]|uniref:hypothetical protein n=1 Tax=Algoriphagus terrigena TaxID=344884 RepID=UPI0003F7112B|nr:hypothetical protein [Algoriphagus terrigena]
MFTFHFKNFLGTLDIQEPNHRGIPPESPIYIFYREEEELSKHEILRRFKRVLSSYNITYLRPLKDLTSEWVVDLQELKHQFICFKDSIQLKGKLTIEPEYIQNNKFDEYNDQPVSEETIIKFSIYQEDIQLFTSHNSNVIPEELNKSLRLFRKDFPINSKCAFLMMKFEDTPIQLKLISTIRDFFKSSGINLLRADDKWYADDLLSNIRTYMHGCDFGVAIFDRVKTEYFNPNVSLEIGYMMAMEKNVLLLKDTTLNSLQTDLVGKLYHEYDFQYPEKTLPLVLEKWLKDKEI